MRSWFGFAVLILALLVSAYATAIRERNKPIPAYAGRLCDTVWSRTRAVQPTVGWYQSCIEEVGKQHEKATAKYTEDSSTWQRQRGQ